MNGAEFRSVTFNEDIITSKVIAFNDDLFPASNKKYAVLHE